jgi:hypothetical protein
MQTEQIMYVMNQQNIHQNQQNNQGSNNPVVDQQS